MADDDLALDVEFVDAEEAELQAVLAVDASRAVENGIPAGVGGSAELSEAAGRGLVWGASLARAVTVRRTDAALEKAARLRIVSGWSATP